MKTKVTSFFLLFSLLAPGLGIYAWLKMDQYRIRNEVKAMMIQGIDKQELTLLKFSKKEASNNLHWEHAGEFEYKNEMYDVVESLEQGDSLYYWCWPDEEENQLNHSLAKLVEESFATDPQQRNQREQISTLFKTLFREQASVFSLNPLDPAKRNWPNLLTESISSLSLTPPFPPPQA